MLRTGFRQVFKTFGTKNFANIPAQERQAISTSFKVQDTKEFTDKVKNSKVPVIVDFFAT